MLKILQIEKKEFDFIDTEERLVKRKTACEVTSYIREDLPVCLDGKKVTTTNVLRSAPGVRTPRRLQKGFGVVGRALLRHGR